MTKKIFLSVCGILLIGVAIVVVFQTFFPKIPDIWLPSWDTTQNEIRDKEPGQLEKETDAVLMYHRKLFTSVPAGLGYYFNEGQLVEIRYAAMNKYSRISGTQTEMLQVENALIEQFGLPERGEGTEERVWQTKERDILLSTYETQDQNYIWILQVRKP